METRTVVRENKEYLVTKDGRIFYPPRKVRFYSPKRKMYVEYIREGREAKYTENNNKYLKAGRWLIHRAVAEAWLGKPEDAKFTVNHKDGNKTNNDVSNLEWLAHKDNIQHWLDSDKAIDDGKVHPIEVTTKSGEFVGVYRMKQDAAKVLNLKKSSISACFSGRLKSTGGYTFRMISKKEFYEKKGLQKETRR